MKQIVLGLIQFFHLFLKCPFYLLTGLYCPGCGITRMFLSLFQFRFYQAFRYNPFVFLCLVGYLVYKLIPYKIPVKYKPLFINSLLIFTILFGILRNIPLFSFLKPTLVSFSWQKIYNE